MFNFLKKIFNSFKKKLRYFSGTMIPKSGGDYAYISDAFGPLPAFLYLWVALFILVPTGNAITALTFAQYILQPVWHGCIPPYAAVRLLAAVITCKNIFYFSCIIIFFFPFNHETNFSESEHFQFYKRVNLIYINI